MRITVTLEMTALSDVRAAIFGMNALKLDRPLLLLPGEVVGKADHLVKVGAEAVVMDMLHFHRQVLDMWTLQVPDFGFQLHECYQGVYQDKGC